MSASGARPACLVCHREADQVPLITLDFRGATFRICPQHLPVLIHHPDELIGTLAGAEGLSPADHHD